MTIRTVILGATGYVGGELLRLVAGHPDFELCAAVSTSRQGLRVADTFAHLRSAYPGQLFRGLDEWSGDLSRGDRVALFSAAPHGASAAMVQRVLADAAEIGVDIHAVDSSADFRYASADEFAQVYAREHEAPGLLPLFTCALPEHVDGRPSAHIGHPGCFATAMLLAAVPLYAAGLVDGPLYIAATTGSTGSGRSPQAGTHHPERHSNMYAYKPLEHRHVPEVGNLVRAATGATADIRFVPHSGAFARGIYATVQGELASGKTKTDVVEAFDAAYRNASFVDMVEGTPRLKNVVASNFAHMGIACSGSGFAITCAIDNLLKGAAGGAVQWMNRLWSLPERSGIDAAAPAWT